MRIERQAVTGLVLAGGRGSRMGGVDKGLQALAGRPLAWHALQRLAPQVGAVLINANRNLDVYRGFGAEVVSDADAEFPGPLAGFQAGLAACRSDWLVTVPCDTPAFPLDLVERLCEAAAGQDALVALAKTPDPEIAGGEERLQPVFCLMHVSLAADLREFMAGGHRRIERWTARHPRAEVLFEDASAFFNANTAEELAEVSQRHGVAP